MNDNITLLDYFAAHAMQGILSREDIDFDAYRSIVTKAYAIANIMLKERDKQYNKKHNGV